MRRSPTPARAAACLILAAALLAGSGCGRRTGLQPLAGDPRPEVPVGARTAPSADELVTPTPQARPDRSDELILRSGERDTDPFDLPPGAARAAASTAAGTVAHAR